MKTYETKVTSYVQSNKTHLRSQVPGPDNRLKVRSQVQTNHVCDQIKIRRTKVRSKSNEQDASYWWRSALIIPISFIVLLIQTYRFYYANGSRHIGIDPNPVLGNTWCEDGNLATIFLSLIATASAIFLVIPAPPLAHSLFLTQTLSLSFSLSLHLIDCLWFYVLVWRNGIAKAFQVTKLVFSTGITCVVQ